MCVRVCAWQEGEPADAHREGANGRLEGERKGDASTFPSLASLGADSGRGRIPAVAPASAQQMHWSPRLCLAAALRVQPLLCLPSPTSSRGRSSLLLVPTSGLPLCSLVSIPAPLSPIGPQLPSHNSLCLKHPPWVLVPAWTLACRGPTRGQEWGLEFQWKSR